jgi:hypothetical protein
VSAPGSFLAPNASLFLETHMADSHAAFSSVRRLKLAGRRIVVETILFFFRKVIHSLD